MRSFIYDTAILPLTTRWYASVLERVSPGAHLLDVGIGTGGALAKNAEIVRSKRIHITGVDIDADYVKACRKRLARIGLSEQVDVHLESVYDHQGGLYDAVYFSASFMLMPDPAACLVHVGSLLKPAGRVFFTQTFQEKKSVLVEKAKPMLHKMTTIRFGKVTYEEDFVRVVEGGGFELLELTTLSQGAGRSHRLAVGRPERSTPAHAV